MSLPATFDKVGMGFNICVHISLLLWWDPRNKIQIGSSAQYVCVPVRLTARVCGRKRERGSAGRGASICNRCLIGNNIRPDSTGCHHRKSVCSNWYCCMKKSSSTWQLLKCQETKYPYLSLWWKWISAAGVCLCVCTSFQMQCLSAYQPAASLGTAHHFAAKQWTMTGLYLMSVS